MAKTSKMTKTAKKVAKIGVIPLGDKVLIKMADADTNEKKSASGIIIPPTAKEEKADRGKVVAVGEGRTDDSGKVHPVRVKVGDTVIFQWGDKITIDDEDYYIVAENGILAVVK